MFVSVCFCAHLYISVCYCRFLSVSVRFCLMPSVSGFLSACVCLGIFLVLVLLSAVAERIVTVYMGAFSPHNLSLYLFHKCMATANRAVVVFVKEFQWDQRIGLIHH